ncbi:pyridoxal phosphate-dependent aminotransferase [Erysipelothrix urinaevulpis]|uniref:pyridoxal phosphate-dependent aminotransferase n=1 Tax=Erysipelothrix urinaevulpis TaxID=2683717 RepID=UPI0013574A9E|nr:aminotransferase class I/II-fold pyridoxal phosphate-dependent enzyme [Erysipelothrix urinaevulpis]
MKLELEQIELSGIRAFSERYKDQKDTLFMTIGEPDFDTPIEIKDAAKKALDDNITHYPPAMGLNQLREKIVSHENKLYKTNYTSNHCIITNGATESLALALWSILEYGDEVIVPIPSFPLYQTQVQLVGAKACLLDTSTHDFQITKAMLDAHVSDKTKALLITTPNNPTGTIFSKESNEAMKLFLEENPGVYLIIDEVYRAMVFGDDYPSMREYPNLTDRIIVVQSFSKSHAMTGWRIGYVLAEENVMDVMHKLHQNMVTGISTLSQKGAEKALEIEMVEMVETFKARSHYVCQRLTEMGINYVKPEGGLYVFFSIKEYGLTSFEFGRQLAETVGLVLIPGVYFGTDGFMRLSFGLPMEELRKGMDRLESFITQRL